MGGRKLREQIMAGRVVRDEAARKLHAQGALLGGAFGELSKNALGAAGRLNDVQPRFSLDPKVLEVAKKATDEFGPKVDPVGEFRKYIGDVMKAKVSVDPDLFDEKGKDALAGRAVLAGVAATIPGADKILKPDVANRAVADAYRELIESTWVGKAKLPVEVRRRLLLGRGIAW